MLGVHFESDNTSFTLLVCVNNVVILTIINMSIEVSIMGPLTK